MKTTSRDYYTIPGTDIEVELPYAPDCIMEYHAPIIRITDDHIKVGYLAHDDSCENPLADDDSAGHIYEARRHGPTLRDYERELALGDYEGRERNPYAVLLDVYEHSGIAYSLNGEGMQCRFDTASGGACWVPSKALRDEIKRRGAVYQKGDVNELRDGTFEVRTLREDLLGYDDTVRPHFQHRYEAFELLIQLEPLHWRDLATAEQIAARELAKQAAEQYTDWCNGRCYGVVVATYDKSGEAVDHDACWGYVGDDSALDALKGAMKEGA